MIRVPQLPQLRPRERLLAVGCGVMLLVVALDRLVLAPWSRHARTIRQDIRQMEDALQQHRRLLARKDQVAAEHERYQRYLQLPVADDLQTAALLKEHEELAGASHVKLIEIKPLGIETSETLKRYTLEVRFTGLLDEWIELVFRIETSPSLYDIVRATLAVSESGPGQLDGSLRVMSEVVNGGLSTPGADGGAPRLAGFQGPPVGTHRRIEDRVPAGFPRHGQGMGGSRPAPPAAIPDVHPGTPGLLLHR